MFVVCIRCYMHFLYMYALMCGMEAIRLDQISPRVMGGTPHPSYLGVIYKKPLHIRIISTIHMKRSLHTKHTY